MSTVGEDLLIERYKHVLSQMAKIDENAHRFLGIYQATVTALVGGAAALWLGYGTLGVSVEQARGGICAALIMVGAVGAFTAIVLAVGAFAWMDYRLEEAVLTAASETFQRSKGTWRNAWRWQETYMALLVLLVSLAVILLGWFSVLPSLSD